MSTTVTTDPPSSPLGATPVTRAANRLGVVGTGFNLIGLGLAAYLTYEHYSTTAGFFCPANSVINCEKVTESSYATFAGVPVAVAGLVYFVVALPLFLPAAWRSENPLVQRARWAWVAVGMVSVLWLIYGELELGAICLYCTGVHVVTFGLLVLTAIGSVVLLEPGVEDEDGETTPADATGP